MTNQPSNPAADEGSAAFGPAEQQAAAEAVTRTLEQTCFLIPDLAEQLDAAPAEPVRVTLAFGGPKPGVLEVATDLRLGRIVAGNMLGCDETDDQAIAAAKDGLQETVNIAAGAMMPDLADVLDAPTDEFPLKLPETSATDENEWADFAGCDRAVRFDIDGLPLVVRLRAA